MSMFLLQNQEPAFCIWHLSTKSKPIGVGKKGFQGNYSLQNQGPSLSPSLTSTESRSEGMTLMSMFLLQNQEPAFCIWHLSTKSKPIGVGKKGFQGNYSLQNQGPSLSPSLTSTESRSEGMTLMSMLLLQNQRPSPKSVPYPKCKVLCTPSWGLGPLFYKSTESGTYQDRSKNDQNWWCLGGCQPMVLDSVARLGFKLALQNRRFLGPQPPRFCRGNCNQDFIFIFIFIFIWKFVIAYFPTATGKLIIPKKQPKSKAHDGRPKLHHLRPGAFPLMLGSKQCSSPLRLLYLPSPVKPKRS